MRQPTNYEQLIQQIKNTRNNKYPYPSSKPNRVVSMISQMMRILPWQTGPRFNLLATDGTPVSQCNLIFRNSSNFSYLYQTRPCKLLGMTVHVARKECLIKTKASQKEDKLKTVKPILI